MRRRRRRGGGGGGGGEEEQGRKEGGRDKLYMRTQSRSGKVLHAIFDSPLSGQQVCVAILVRTKLLQPPKK